MSEDYVSLVIQGEAKTGKTWFGTSGPGTTLVLDAEAGGMRFVPGNKITWDVDAGQSMPERGDWQICRVPIRGLMTLQRVRDNLQRDHPFNNITMDSLTEMQDQVKAERSPTFQLEQRDWGYIFGVMNDITVTFRDIVSRDEKLRSFVVVCGTVFQDGLFRPMIAGQFGKKLPYKMDGIGFLLRTKDQENNIRRALILGESNQYETGHRLGAAAPEVLWEPTVTKLLNAVFGTDYPEAR